MCIKDDMQKSWIDHILCSKVFISYLCAVICSLWCWCVFRSQTIICLFCFLGW